MLQFRLNEPYMMLLQFVILFSFTGTRAVNWAVCESIIRAGNEQYTFCDLCYVRNQDSLVFNPPKLTLLSNETISKSNCFQCWRLGSTIASFDLRSYTFVPDCNRFLQEQSHFSGIMVLYNRANSTYDDIIRVTGDVLDTNEDTVPWIFLRTGTTCLNDDISNKLELLLSDISVGIHSVTLTTSVIDLNEHGVFMYDLYSTIGMECIVILILIAVILIKRIDRRHIVYSLDQFIDCSRINRRIEFSVYIARFNKLAVFFSILFLIIFSILAATVSNPMQFFFYLGHGVSSATAFMFLIARIPMKLQNRCVYFKKRSYQVAFIVITTTIGTLASLIILLLRDESAFKFNGQLLNMCIKILPFWFLVNIMIVVALLSHITFRSFVEVALFEVSCIVVDQLFRTLWYTSNLHEYKQSKPFLDFYYTYGESVFQVNQGFKYQNSSINFSSFEPHSTPDTNPYTFKWHWHYAGFACQIPYSRFFPIWFVTTPGYALLHGIHFNSEQSEHKSKVFPVIAFLLAIIGSLSEELIRIFFNVPLGIGVISFPILSLFFVLWFCKQGEIGDFIHGVYVYVSRSHVSSGVDRILLHICTQLLPEQTTEKIQMERIPFRHIHIIFNDSQNFFKKPLAQLKNIIIFDRKKIEGNL